MKITIELNKRFGYGYQVKTDSTEGFRWPILDKNPYNLYEALQKADDVLRQINRELKKKYTLESVVWITPEAVRANAKRDVASAMMLKEIEDKSSVSVSVVTKLHN